MLLKATTSFYPSPLPFKPHHFLCTLGFEGKGYSSAFIDNFSAVKTYLESEEGKDHLLQVTLENDIICSPCPHKRETLCSAQSKIEKLDLAHLNALSLGEKETLTWKEAKEKIKHHIALDTFNAICTPCEWKKFGMCEKALENLLTA